MLYIENVVQTINEVFCVFLTQRSSVFFQILIKSINECSNIEEIKNIAKIYQTLANSIPEQHYHFAESIKGISTFQGKVFNTDTNELLDALDFYHLLKFIRVRFDLLKQGLREPQLIGWFKINKAK